MAKKIKAIKCPHCGSVSKTKLEKDLYHCDSCSTDYFLDNDEINININNKTSIQHDIAYFFKNKLRLTIIGIFCTLVFFIMMISFITSSPTPSRQYNSYSSSSLPPTQQQAITPSKPAKPATPVETEVKYSNYTKVFYTFINNKNQAYSFSIAYRAHDKYSAILNGIYYEIREVITGKLVKKALLEKTENNDNWYFRRFDNGVAYIVYNDLTVYAFDEQQLSVSNVTQSLFKNRSEFISGIATINLTPWGYEDSFYVLTNNGKEYFFYPLLNKVYKYDADYDELMAYSRTLNKKREKTEQPYIRTLYQFEKLNGKNSGSTLIKVVYETDSLSPLDKFAFSSVSNAEKPYKILTYNQKIIEDKALAVGRIFFDPTVVYSTKDTLIIRVKNNASSNAYYNLQSLDPNTGEVKWTVQGDEKRNFSSYSNTGNLDVWSKYKLDVKKLFIPYQNGYLVQLDYGSYITISKTGDVSEFIQYKPEKILSRDID